MTIRAACGTTRSRFSRPSTRSARRAANSAPRIPAMSRPRSPRAPRRTSPSCPTPRVRPDPRKGSCCRTPICAAAAFAKAEDVRPGDNMLCYLPMAWIGDSLLSLVLHQLVGFTANCPERPDTVQRDLRELGPTIGIAPPRIWENMLTAIRVRAADASPLKRRVFDFFQRLAEAAELLKAEGKKPGPAMRLGLCLGEVFVYRPVRDRLGLARARWFYTGGAPLGPETFRFFRALGVNLKQVWGATELSGLASLQPDGEANPDTVGPLLAG